MKKRIRIVADEHVTLVGSAFGDLGELVAVPARHLDRSLLKNADALVVRSETQVDRELLEGTKVKFVGTTTIGFDHLDTHYLRKKNIAFANAPGCNSNAVKEYVLAALLTLSRRTGVPLEGSTLGIVGVGNIGSRVARMAGLLGMRVLLNDPPLARYTNNHAFLPLDALMESDFLTLHVPLTKEGEDPTFHLFDRGRIGKMKKGSILVNSARGAVVETLALKDALKTKHLRGAVLDVWEREPEIDVELLALADLGTPHIAGYSVEGKINATEAIRSALCRHFHLSPHPKTPPSVFHRRRKQITVDAGEGRLSMRLEPIIRRCYNIENDDRTLRRIITMDESHRGWHFEVLRSEYDLRREFLNFDLRMKKEDPILTAVCSELGFSSVKE